MHHVAMAHHNSHLVAPVGAPQPQYTPPPQPPHTPLHTPATPVSRRSSVDSNSGTGKKRKRGAAAGYDHNGMLSEVRNWPIKHFF